MKTVNKFTLLFFLFVIFIVICLLLFCSCSTLRKEPVLITRQLENGYEGIYQSDNKVIDFETQDSAKIGCFYILKEHVYFDITLQEYTERENEVISNVIPIERLLK